jgi:hypothetical protein
MKCPFPALKFPWAPPAEQTEKWVSVVQGQRGDIRGISSLIHLPNILPVKHAALPATFGEWMIFC